MSNDHHPNEQLARLIKNKAAELGFDACGFARAERVDPHHQQAFSQWIEEGCQGQMHYMRNYKDKRMDPALLVEGARSVICLAINYHQQDFQPPDACHKVSQYAAGTDYHHVVKKKLFALLQYIQGQTEIGVARVFTDSAPVLERYWAQQAGLGAPGKNSCLILPGRGSYYFLAEIILDLELPYDAPYGKDLCGKCSRCIDACPTAAITEPGKIDARRCISYHTIELKEAVPAEFSGQTRQYIFGCDICQQVCPHNLKFATPCIEPEFKPIPALKEWTKEEWENLDKSTYRKSFIKTRSPLARASYEKLRENIANSREQKSNQ